MNHLSQDKHAVYHKTRVRPPTGFFDCERSGLQWLAQASALGGPAVAAVHGSGDDYLDTVAIDTTNPTPLAAYDFGRRLARMHDAGAAHFGSAPAGYVGPCYFGPLMDPIPMPTGEWDDPLSYYAQGRLLPVVQTCVDQGVLTSDDLNTTRRVIDVMPSLLGQAAEDQPCRVHGDLWNGNILWSELEHGTQAVLIDPAAHGGHREEDLAMLSLFGMHYFEMILEGYQSIHALAAGYRKRFQFWNLYPIAANCIFFVGGYVSQYREACRTLLNS